MDVKTALQSSEAVRAYREALLSDPYRPVWHFAVPDDNGVPGDPNGAFYADGRYHLMYLYRNTAKAAFHWGHISSHDLLHWRHHPGMRTRSSRFRGFSVPRVMDTSPSQG